jgi:Family of unknown function (DUF6065)
VDQHVDQLDRGTGPAHDASSPNHTAEQCTQCQLLEARIKELEAAIAQRNQQDATRSSETAPGLFPLEFKALRIFPHGWAAGWQLRPSPARRHWMDEVPHAYKCLPLVIANQWGWQILCPTDVIVTWSGDPNPSGLQVEVAPEFAPAIKSQFGLGIVTFSPPWLFRTPPGWDLYLKGPSNRWKSNCIALDGVIETWWLNYTFTVNWKLVFPGTVRFSAGESIGQLIPVPHATFQESTATEAPIRLVEPKAAKELVEWQLKRQQIAGQKINVHQLYRKADGIEDHLTRISVPAVVSITPQNQSGSPP